MDLALYVVTEAVPELGRTHLDVTRAAIDGGATVIQFREKRESGSALVEAAAPVRDLCAERGVPFVMNDDARVAMRLRADGLHVGQDDLGSLGDWRPTWEALLGVSVTSPEQVDAAQELGADYVGAGPVFSTLTKGDAAEPMGLEGIEATRARASVPVVAIGGISEESVESVIEAGADGVAVVSAVSRAPDPMEAARRLRALILGALSRKGAM